MNRISSFQIPVAAEELRAAPDGGVHAALAEPLQVLVANVSRRTADAPLTIYLCSDDGAAAARDVFAFALARTLTAHVPSTLLIDCDFVRPGLHGAVPQKDALGFLDFLLYGSSIGVITQETGGVHVVGAGSFPVTKRMPFVESAFADAARRLVTHARCAIFVGPCFDEAGGVHPLAASVDVVTTLRTARHDPRLDAAEEQVTGGGAEVWSLRLGRPAAAPAAATAAEPAVPAPAAIRPARVATAAPAAPARPAPKVGAGPDAETRYSSLVPKIAVLAFALVVIAFVGWWFTQNRSTGGDSEETASSPPHAPVSAPAIDSLGARADTAAADTTARPGGTVRPVRADTTRARTEGRPPVNPADTSGRSGGTVLVNPADIHVMADLEQQYRGWYAIHISSFQTSIRARDEVAFLQSREFPVFIVFLDLGPKGKWYRVYAGPFRTREEAREVKKNLDAVPQVRFTRIASIPE